MEPFLQGVVDPQSTGIPSPIYNAMASSAQTIHITGAFSSLRNGAVVWLPHRSPNSVYVMAPLVSEVTPATAAYPPIIDNGNDGLSGITIQQIQVLPIQLSNPFTHADLPYNYLVVPGATAAIRYSPGDVFAGSVSNTAGIRPYNGMLQLTTDVDSDDAANGEMHAFSLADIRDLRTLPVDRLSTLAVPKSDVVWAESADKGVVSVIGPDIPLEYAT
jgi:hypothetical protein